VTWFKVCDSLATHQKIGRLRSYGGHDRLAAIGLWTLAGSSCAASLGQGGVVDGYISRVDLEALAYPLTPDMTHAAAAQLVAVKLWDEHSEGYRFHDWKEYQPTSSKVRKTKGKWKADKARSRATKKAAASMSTNMSTSDNVVDSTSDTSKCPPRTPPLPGPDPGPDPHSSNGGEGLTATIALRWRRDFETHRGISAAPPNDTDVRKLAAWIRELAAKTGRDAAAIVDAVSLGYWADPFTKTGRPSVANLISQADRIALAAFAPRPVVVDPHEYNRIHGLAPRKAAS
jgi:hypothetical protein